MSASFVAIGVVVNRMARKQAFIFKTEHYGFLFKLLMLGFIMLFFVPLFGIFALTYLHGDDSATSVDDASDKGPSSLWLLTRWMMDCMMEDKAGVPLIYTIVLHI